MAVTNFTASAASTAVIPNPRRGFFQYTETHYRSDNTGYVPLVSADLAAARTGSTSITESGTAVTFSGRTVVFRYFYMEKYKVNGAAIEQAYLDKVTADLAAVKAAGCTVRLRFAYDDTFQSTGPWTSDVNLATVQAHQNQLAPIINAYADVVDSVDAGLIGTYGEWFYTSNFTTSGNLDAPNATDVSNRNAVITNWLSKLDARIFVNLRYLGSRQAFLGSTSPNPGGTSAPRLGHHNDAFLADDGNYGTYASMMTFAPQTVAQARAYLDGITSIPVQGESANYAPPGSDWAPTGTTWGGAAVELASHHYTSLNPQYHPDTLKAWGQTNIDTAQRSLGYRLRLVSGSYTNNPTAGSDMTVSVVIANDGYAAPYRLRPLEVVFVNGATVVRQTLTADIRNLAPGASTTITGTVSAPAAGTWTMHLNLPDPSSSLASNPAYSIQLANTTGWDSTTGYNATGQSLTVGAGTSTTYTFTTSPGRIPGLTPQTTYTAVIRAVDGAGNRSATSTAYSFTTTAADVTTFTGTSGTIPNLTPGGTYTFNVRAVDNAGNRSAISSAVTVTLPTPPPTIYAEPLTVNATASFADYTAAEVGTAAVVDPILLPVWMDTYLSAVLSSTNIGIALTANNTTSGTLTWSATGLPPGLVISIDGVISGTPTTAGSYTAVVTVTSSTGPSSSTSIPWTISP